MEEIINEDQGAEKANNIKKVQNIFVGIHIKSEGKEKQWKEQLKVKEEAEEGFDFLEVLLKGEATSKRRTTLRTGKNVVHPI